MSTPAVKMAFRHLQAADAGSCLQACRAASGSEGACFAEVSSFYAGSHCNLKTKATIDRWSTASINQQQQASVRLALRRCSSIRAATAPVQRSTIWPA